MATREGRSTRAARKRKTLSDEFTTQYSRKSSKKKGAVQIPDETIAHEQVTPGADPTTNKPNHSSKIGPSATKTEVCKTKAEQSASLVIKQDEEPSNISDIGNELGLTLDHHEDLLAPKSEIEIDPNDLYSELFSYVTTREQNTSKETYYSDTHSLQNCMSEDGNKPDTVQSETSSALSQHIKAEPTVHEELMNQNEGHESDSKNEEAQEGTDDGAPSDHAQTPEPSLSSPDNIDEGQLSHTPSKPKMRPWTVYEEERLLIKLNELLSVEKNQTPQIRLLRRQLHVRKVKRSQGLPVFDISSYLYKAEHEHLPCEHKSPSRLRLQCRDVIPSVGLSAPVVSSSDNLTTQQKILDRFQMPYPAEQTSYFVPFTRRLHGGNYQLRNTRSPYTSRILKAFIWRDYETKPTKLKLLDEIRSHSPDVDGGNRNAVCESIDYRYVSAEHIPVINRICHQAFWPTIDLSECLQYSDFSCVAMYKKLIIGFAFMVPDVRHDEAYISFIYTHPEWRGAGIASIMMYHLIQTCMGKDVTLHVSMTNPALNLYLKFGFKIVEVIHNFYEKYHPVDSSQSPHAFYMRLDRG